MFRLAASKLLNKGGPPAGGWASLSNSELAEAVRAKKIPFYSIEAAVKPDYERAVAIRRDIVAADYATKTATTSGDAAINKIPYQHYDWSRVMGQNCENVIGYVPVPVGVVGPLTIDGKPYIIPMATTEGALLASAHRGANAINQSGGCLTAVLSEGMTRAPVVAVTSLEEAAKVKTYCEEHFDEIKAAFESTTRYGKLWQLKVTVAGRRLFLRFRATTGDAMGMNMITKGTDKALELIGSQFPAMQVLALSGNYCTDKKPSAVNWIEGRGKSVVAEATVKASVVEKVLKSSVDAVVSLNTDKNLTGSIMAGSIGGFNAHAANLVAAIFLATGQDPAQVVESCTCLTNMSKTSEGDLLISATMPSIEVGAVGGGTGLPAQRGCLDLFGAGGASQEDPGANSRLVSRVVAAGVLCGELSLMSGLAAGHLLRAHLALNRKPPQ